MTYEIIMFLGSGFLFLFIIVLAVTIGYIYGHDDTPIDTEEGKTYYKYDTDQYM